MATELSTKEMCKLRRSEYKWVLFRDVLSEGSIVQILLYLQYLIYLSLLSDAYLKRGASTSSTAHLVVEPVL